MLFCGDKNASDKQKHLHCSIFVCTLQYGAIWGRLHTALSPSLLQAGRAGPLGSDDGTQYDLSRKHLLPMLVLFDYFSNHVHNVILC